VSLVSSHRYSSEDLAVWRRRERQDRVWGSSAAFRSRVASAERAIMRFLSAGDAWVAVSWGKDSVVVADMAARLCPDIPVIHVRVDPLDNPDCPSVRDAFLERHPLVAYEEIVETCTHDKDGWHATGTLERGFARAVKAYGLRSINGIRGQESRVRALRVRRWGQASPNRCAPLAWWSGPDVFAYLYQRSLPVHPAYACSLVGTLDRDRIRVAFLDLKHGRGRGRQEWERRYYPDVIGSLR